MLPQEAVELHGAITREARQVVRAQSSAAAAFAETGTVVSSPGNKFLLADVAGPTKDDSNSRQLFQESCMLRVATDTILAERLQKLKYLEGRLAALEAVRRKSIRKNVAFWTEALWSAGSDYVLLGEKARAIQSAWRARVCRQKLRYALMSVVRCSTCGNRAQIPRKTKPSAPFFAFEPKFRCASCRSVIVTALHPIWLQYVGPQSQFVGGSVSKVNKSSQDAGVEQQRRLHKALENAGLEGDARTSVEKKLLTFTEFWQPQHLEEMMSGSPLSFARGIHLRTGTQLHEPTTPQSARVATAEMQEPTAATAVAKEDSSTPTATGVGIERVQRKNVRAVKWQGLTTLVLNQRALAVAKTHLDEELASLKASKDAALQAAQTTTEADAQIEPQCKFPKGTKILAGLPAWGDDKYPGVIHCVNGGGTYGVIFDVSLSPSTLSTASTPSSLSHSSSNSSRFNGCKISLSQNATLTQSGW